MPSLARLLVCSSFLHLAACGSTAETPAPEKLAHGEKESEGSRYDYGQKFAPKAVAEGYTRVVAPVIKDIPPGADITYCQYILPPVEQTVDILHVTGEQSAGGHHAVAFATTASRLGESAECREDEQMENGGFLGGTGGDGAAITLPEGVAFRLSEGNGIMINSHFINTSDDFVDGESVLDLKFVEVDRSRKIAGFFALNYSGFEIPPSGKEHASSDCVFDRDAEIFALSNHMHEYGASASTHVTRAVVGTPELVNEVKAWSPEMVGNPRWAMFLESGSLKMAKGDTMTVDCNWENTTASPLVFPREMCVITGFFYATDAEFRACSDGVWIDAATAL
jgi:hypothetical protein